MHNGFKNDSNLDRTSG